MTELLQKFVQAAEALTPEQQDALACLAMGFLEDMSEDGVVELTPEEEAAISESLAQAERGEFATAEQVEAVFARFRG